MVENNEISSGGTYAFKILEMWFNIIDIGVQFKMDYLRNHLDHENTYQYVALLCRMWVELLPKMKSRSEFGDLTKEFEDFRDLCYDPKKLMASPDKILRLEEVLRDAIERLGITKFGGSE